MVSPSIREGWNGRGLAHWRSGREFARRSTRKGLCTSAAAGGKLPLLRARAGFVEDEGPIRDDSTPDSAAPAPDQDHGDGEVTALLRRAHVDRREALDALVPIVYDTLRRIARQQLAGERRGHTLTATALAHEAYARLVGLTRIEWRDRAHFFAAAAGAMRRVLIDYAAARNTHKRGSGADRRRTRSRRDRRRRSSRRSADRERRADAPRSGPRRRRPRRGVPGVRRDDDRRDGGGAGHLTGHREAALGTGASLAGNAFETGGTMKPESQRRDHHRRPTAARWRPPQASDRWERLAALFEGALALAPGERDAFVANTARIPASPPRSARCWRHKWRRRVRSNA